MQQIDEDIVHHDSSIFPGNTYWFRLLEEHIFGIDTKKKILVARSRKLQPLAVLPIMICNSRYPGRKVLSALKNYYTADFRPLLSNAVNLNNVKPMIHELLENSPPDLVILAPLDMDDESNIVMTKAFFDAGWYCYCEPVLVNWRHVLEPNYEQYIASRPRNIRNTIERKKRKLSSMKNTSVEVFSGCSDVELLIDQYEQVYSRSWKTAEPEFTFMPALITRLAGAGTLRIGFVYVEKIPIAVHLWIVCSHTAYIFKLAHDKKYDKLSPGTVLMASMIEYVMEKDNVTTLDFMTGDDEYKKHWMSDRRVKHEFRAYNPRSFYGLLAQIKYRGILPLFKKLRNLSNDKHVLEY